MKTSFDQLLGYTVAITFMVVGLFGGTVGEAARQQLQATSFSLGFGLAAGICGLIALLVALHRKYNRDRSEKSRAEEAEELSEFQG